jgi:hypothetical protein
LARAESPLDSDIPEARQEMTAAQPDRERVAAADVLGPERTLPDTERAQQRRRTLGLSASVVIQPAGATQSSSMNANTSPVVTETAVL